jgi:hypothetical protein
MPGEAISACTLAAVTGMLHDPAFTFGQGVRADAKTLLHKISQVFVDIYLLSRALAHNARHQRARQTIDDKSYAGTRSAACHC